MIHKSTQEWAITNFGNALLFNKTRVRRLVKIAARLAESKGTSLARLFDCWYDTKATYNLLKQPVMTPNCIQKTHREVALLHNRLIND